MKSENKLDPRLKKLIKVWFPITMLLIRKMKDHCLKCMLFDCKECKYLKLNCLLEEIDTILEEDNILNNHYTLFEQVGVLFSNLDDE